MVGKYTHSFDPKGRLFVPSKLREELGPVFYVLAGLEHSLLVFPEAKFDEVMERINAAPISKAKAKRFILANVAKCEPDRQGRFVLPPTLRKYANLNGDVTFLGQGDHGEIWDAATYEAGENEWMSGSGDMALDYQELGL